MRYSLQVALKRESSTMNSDQNEFVFIEDESIWATETDEFDFKKLFSEKKDSKETVKSIIESVQKWKWALSDNVIQNDSFSVQKEKRSSVGYEEIQNKCLLHPLKIDDNYFNLELKEESKLSMYKDLSRNIW